MVPIGPYLALWGSKKLYLGNPDLLLLQDFLQLQSAGNMDNVLKGGIRRNWGRGFCGEVLPLLNLRKLR